ncbi:MAG TPA: VOC family protein [Gemmataceae bacterium]|nr:VOC family protein [Gemmataceae bacterium]
MTAIQTIVETGIYADDLQAAEQFYHAVLGLPVVTREAGRSVFFQVGSSSMLLVFDPSATIQSDHMASHGARGPGHFALGIPAGSLAEWRGRLAAHGVPIEQEKRWPRGGQSLYFRDPAGNLVELLTPGLWGLPAGW